MLTAVLEEVVQGPVSDARFGRHLLVSPMVESGRPGRYASQAIVVTRAARRMIELNKAGEKLASVVVAGRQDPTKHGDFREIAENLRELCKKWFPRAHLCLVSPLPQVDQPDVRQGLVCFHRVYARFEAGTQKTFQALTGQPGRRLKELASELARLDLSNITIQAQFLRGAVDNSTDNELRSWLRYLSEIRPSRVEISTLPKPDAASKTKPITSKRLDEIAEKISEKLGLTPELAP